MPAPAPKLPDAIVALVDEHRYLNLLLDTLAEHLQASDLTAKENFFLMQDIVHYMHEYPDVVHHPTEDLMFDKLVRRNPASELHVARLRREHDKLTRNTAKILELLDVAAKRRTPKAADAVRSTAESYIERLKEHMAFEEAELFPTAVRCLSSSDWHDIDVRLEAAQDPLFGPTVQSDYRALYEYFTDRAERLSRQVTRFGFLQLDNMILTADVIETGIAEMLAMLQVRADFVARELRMATDKTLDGRGLTSALAAQIALAGIIGKTVVEAGGKATSIYFRTLKKAINSLFQGTQ